MNLVEKLKNNPKNLYYLIAGIAFVLINVIGIVLYANKNRDRSVKDISVENFEEPTVTPEITEGPTPTDWPTPTPEPKATNTPSPKATATVSPSPTPTPTPGPANTPIPTNTPVPENITAPTSSPSATPAT